MNEYLVAHGKNGAFGRFVANEPVSLGRGDRVVIETGRGIELGEVLCPANDRHVHFLHTASPGRLVRPAGPQDHQAIEASRSLATAIFNETRSLIASLKADCEVLDVEVLHDGRRAIVQYVGEAGSALQELVETLHERHGIDVLAENLAPVRDEPEGGGCGKPDCGRAGDGGGCTTCGTGGGCGTCGSAKVDMGNYFAHLRGKMEASQRVPLV